MSILLRLLFGFWFRSSRSNAKYNKFGTRPPPNIENANKIQALTTLEVKQKIQHFAKARVVYVKDGDSVVVAILKDKNEIRLDSIDCPENDQPWGNNAAAGLIKLIGGKYVRLEQHGQDPYRRTLATIYVWNSQNCEWINVNERMVMLGHAWVMRRHYDHLPPDRQRKLNRLEQWAKSKKVGLWNDPNAIAPWNWRANQP